MTKKSARNKVMITLTVGAVTALGIGSLSYYNASSFTPKARRLTVLAPEQAPLHATNRSWKKLTEEQYKIQNLANQNQQQAEKIQELKKDLYTSQHRLNTLNLLLLNSPAPLQSARVNQLNAKLTQYELNNQELLDVIKKLETELSESKKKIVQMNVTIDSLVGAVETQRSKETEPVANEEKALLEERLEFFQEQLAERDLLLEELEESLGELPVASAQHEESEVAKLSELITEINHELTLEKEKNLELQEQVEDLLPNRVSFLEKQLSERDLCIQELRERLETPLPTSEVDLAKDRLIQQLQEEVENLSSAREVMTSNLTSEISQQLAAEKTKNLELQELIEELTMLSDEPKVAVETEETTLLLGVVNNVKQELEGALAENVKLQDKITELSAEREQEEIAALPPIETAPYLTQLSKEREKTKALLEGLNLALTELSTEKDTSKAIHNLLENSTSENLAYTQEICEQQEIIASLEETSRQLEEQLDCEIDKIASLEETIEELLPLKEEVKYIPGLVEQLESQKRKTLTLEEQLKDYNDSSQIAQHLAALSDELESQKRKNVYLQKSVERLTPLETELKSQEDLYKEIGQLHQQIRSLQEIINRSESHLETKEKYIQQLTDERQKTKVLLDELNVTMDELNQEQSQSKSLSNKINHMIEEHSSRSETMQRGHQEEKESLRNRMSLLIKDHEQESMQQKKEAKKLSQNIEIKSHFIAKLQKDLDKSKNEVQEIRTSLDKLRNSLDNMTDRFGERQESNQDHSIDDRLETILIRMTAELKKTKATLEQSTLDTAELQNENEVLRQKFENSTELLQDQDVLERRLNEKMQRIDELESYLERAEIESDDLQNEIEQLETNIEETKEIVSTPEVIPNPPVRPVIEVPTEEDQPEAMIEVEPAPLPAQDNNDVRSIDSLEQLLDDLFQKPKEDETSEAEPLDEYIIQHSDNSL